MAKTLWELNFQDQSDVATLDYHNRIARPVGVGYIDYGAIAGYVMQWPLQCPHCNQSLLIEPVAQEDIQDAVVLLAAEERLSSAPCPYCQKDIATQRATKQTIEQWEQWLFGMIWVAVPKGECVQVEQWET